MSNVILANRGDEQKVIAEEKEEWIYQVLVALGVKEEFLIESNNEQVVDYLNTLYIEVFDNRGDESVEIWKNGKVIAEWKQPKLIMKKEGEDIYYEIHLSEWALPFQMARKGEK